MYAQYALVAPGRTSLLLFFVALSIASFSVERASAGRLSVLYNEYSDGSGPIHLSVLDPESGLIDSTDARTVTFPDSDCQPGWSLGNGTHGQTSTVFQQNQSIFVMAQEKCMTQTPAGPAQQLRNMTLFGMFAGVFEAFEAHDWYAKSELRRDPDEIRTYATFSELDNHSVLEVNIDWDHTANVLVVAPVVLDPEAPQPDPPQPPAAGRQVIEVSEYDGEKRPKAVFDTPPACRYPLPHGGCWRRVEGMSAVDARPLPRLAENASPTRSNYSAAVPVRSQEENCGNCSYYSLEERVTAGGEPVPGAPRQLLGRRVQTGDVSLNITDSTQLLSLAFFAPEFGPNLGMPEKGAFLGVGVCCELAWCPPECEGHGGDVTLVGWVPGMYARPTVLTVLSARPDTFTAQLGLALDVSGFPVGSPESGKRQLRASIMAGGGRIFSLNVSATGDASFQTLSAALMDVSPPVTQKLNAWWYAGF
jgi:hypothetical protein